jgi:hypothetical protein
MTATTTLADLENLYAMRDLMAMDKAAKRAQIIPAEVQAELDELEMEYASKEAAVAEKIADAEKFLKEQVAASGEKIVGTNFYVKFTRGGPQVKADDVLRVADRFEKTVPEVAAELRSIITRKKNSASIMSKE